MTLLSHVHTWEGNGTDRRNKYGAADGLRVPAAAYIQESGLIVNLFWVGKKVSLPCCLTTFNYEYCHVLYPPMHIEFRKRFSFCDRCSCTLVVDSRGISGRGASSATGFSRPKFRTDQLEQHVGARLCPVHHPPSCHGLHQPGRCTSWRVCVYSVHMEHVGPRVAQCPRSSSSVRAPISCTAPETCESLAVPCARSAPHTGRRFRYGRHG